MNKLKKIILNSAIVVGSFLLDESNAISDNSTNSFSQSVAITTMPSKRDDLEEKIAASQEKRKKDSNNTSTNPTTQATTQQGESGIDIKYAYYPGNLMKSQIISRKDKIISQRYYEYDNLGNIKRLYNAPPTTTKPVAEFSYDNLSRLTDIKDFGYYGHNYHYTYDKVGNILSKTVDSITTTYTYYPGTNLLKSNGIYNYTYDANGNRKSKIDAKTGGIVMKYSYDCNNRLTQVDFPDSTSVKYVYDFRGKLIKEIDRKGKIIIHYHGE